MPACRTALTGGAAGLVATVIAACGGDGDKPGTSAAQSGTPASGVFGEKEGMKFTFVNHVTTNPFFVPTRYGAEDACKLVNCSFQWTGSESANVNEMVNAFNSAITAKADGIKQSGAPIKIDTIATGAALPKELSTVDAYYVGHKDIKGMFAVDAGSTQAVAQVIQKYKLRDKGVKGGGYDLLEPTMNLLADGQLDFTIDQQPYLQGFYPVMELFLYQASKTLTGVAEVNTGLKFLTKETVVPYVTTKSRYEGNSEAAGVTQS